MEARIYELLEFPQRIESQDISLIESNLKLYPYMQSLRALQLFGIKKYEQNDYDKKLSLTAAFTAEKKNLFLLLNSDYQTEEVASKEITAKDSELINDLNEEKPEIFEKIANHNYETAVVQQENKVELQNPSENRILFPGEENFLESEGLKIDHEATKESGKITFATENIAVSNFVENKEKIEIPSDTQAESDFENSHISHDINFQETSEFLPEMKIVLKNEKFYPKKEVLNKHEDEMQRLIAEVEAKMNRNKTPKTAPEPDIISDEVNFSENHDIPQETKVEIPQEDAWKPMTLEPTPINSEPHQNQKMSNSEKLDNETKETFSEQDSNVPVFINTWQNWLKISPKQNQIPADDNKSADEKVVELAGNTEPVYVVQIQESFNDSNEEISVSEIDKEELLDNFIQNNPKISRVSDDATFAVKERSYDISHLMTETFAGLYVEQKLYSKAIKAYEILKEKFPENQEKYDQKIEQIKEMRSAFKP